MISIIYLIGVAITFAIYYSTKQAFLDKHMTLGTYTTNPNRSEEESKSFYGKVFNVVTFLFATFWFVTVPFSYIVKKMMLR